MESTVVKKSEYEFFLVISSNLNSENIEGLVKKFEDLISSSAELKNVDRWGKRKFAYPIKKETEGEYILFDFESDSKFPAELDRISRITDGVLRTMIVKKDLRAKKNGKNSEETEKSEEESKENA